MNFIEVITDNICLRELALSDLPLLNQWRNDKEIVDYLGTNFRFISCHVDEAWYQSYLKNRDQQVRLAIIVKNENTQQYVGNVNLTAIHPINLSAEFSIMIGDKSFWAQGVGSQATRLMLEHGFSNLNLNRIYLTVLKENERAIHMYEKLGFQVEGCHRQAIFKNGAYQDLLIMAILKSDFKASS